MSSCLDYKGKFFLGVNFILTHIIVCVIFFCAEIVHGMNSSLSVKIKMRSIYNFISMRV